MIHWWWTMRWAGWERLVHWQTFLAADVSALSHNILNMVFRTKIWTPWIMWELICLDDSGLRLVDPRVKNITPEVEIPQTWPKKKATEVRGGLCCQALEVILAKWLAYWRTGPLTKRAHSRHSAPSYCGPSELTVDRCPPHTVWVRLDIRDSAGEQLSVCSTAYCSAQEWDFVIIARSHF